MNTKTLVIVAGGIALAALPSARAGEAEVRKIRQLDVDGDGRISHAEYIAGETAQFVRMDANSDGIVTAAEMAAGLEQPLTAPGKLGAADANADGQVTRAEEDAYLETRFLAMDTDKDGLLTEKELEAGAKAAQPDK